MKVVINKCYGGFGLSDDAIKECMRLGMTVTELDEKGHYLDQSAFFAKAKGKHSEYWCVSRSDKELRTHPTVIQVVEEMGHKADGDSAALKVIEIPYDRLHGWEIEDHDGREKIVEDHSCWS